MERHAHGFVRHQDTAVGRTKREIEGTKATCIARRTPPSTKSLAPPTLRTLIPTTVSDQLDLSCLGPTYLSNRETRKDPAARKTPTQQLRTAAACNPPTGIRLKAAKMSFSGRKFSTSKYVRPRSVLVASLTDTLC